MKRLSTHGFKVSLVSLAVLNSLASYAAEGSDEELEVIGVHYAKPITVAEPAQTTIDWSLIEEQQYSNFADMIDSVPGATLDGGARSGGNVSISAVLMIQVTSLYLLMAHLSASNNTVTVPSSLTRS
nr:hypothetical protein [Vibrio harveyi]